MSAFALELRRVSRRFGDVVALTDANLRVRAGTVHAVLGENGAGKTTLMRIAFGMLQPASGEILIDGAARRLPSPAEAIAAGIGMVQQHPSNVGAMAVWENVVLGGAGRLDPRSMRNAVQALIDSLGFSLDAESRVDQLPVASQQRLEILKAIHRKARLLILDEPTAILAPEEARELYTWLRGFAQGGGTAVVVTHKLAEARQFTDELTVLRARRTVLETSSASVSPAALTQAMIGAALAESTGGRRSAARGQPVLTAAAVTIVDERKVEVIRDASFDVRPGEIVGVAGIEGSGHHQLLLALARRLPVARGELRSEGALSFIPEDRHRDAVVLPFSLLENFVIHDAGQRRGRIPWNALQRPVATMMDHFDVRATGPATEMQTLSGGNQQKFVLGRELSADPRVIVAENPTRGLDIRATAAVHEHLRAARDRGAAVVLYSSDLDELLDLADRMLVVHAGAVTEAPLDRARVGALMLGAA